MNHISLESLKVFCDVVRQKSFSRGAALNQISQSAASQAISQIERNLGVRLIDRSKRPFTLTPEGRLFYRECRDIVGRYLALEARIRNRRGETPVRLNVATIYSVVLYDMNSYVEKFLAFYPNAQVRFRYFHPEDVYNSVLNEQSELGLLSFPRSRREIQVVPWRDEPMVLVCSPKHRFAQLGKISVGQLEGENFVAFDPALAIRRSVDDFLRRHGVEVNVIMAFDNIEFIKRGIENTGTMSILPEPTVCREVQNGSLCIVEMPELDLIRPLCIIHRRKRVLMPEVLKFIEILRGGKKALEGCSD